MNEVQSSSQMAIEVCDIRKSYPNGGRSVEALRGISFSVQSGEIYALLGLIP